MRSSTLNGPGRDARQYAESGSAEGRRPRPANWQQPASVISISHSPLTAIRPSGTCRFWWRRRSASEHGRSRKIADLERSSSEIRECSSIRSILKAPGADGVDEVEVDAMDGGVIASEHESAIQVGSGSMRRVAAQICWIRWRKRGSTSNGATTTRAAKGFVGASEQSTIQTDRMCIYASSRIAMTRSC
jgi:hypothetical protein